MVLYERWKGTVWSNKDFNMKLKKRLYKALIVLVVKFTSEILPLKSSDENKLLVFEMQCLRAILGSTCRDRLHIVQYNT